MYTYRGIDDPMRVSPLELSHDKFEEKMSRLMMVRNNLRMEGPVRPFSDVELPCRYVST